MYMKETLSISSEVMPVWSLHKGGAVGGACTRAVQWVELAQELCSGWSLHKGCAVDLVHWQVLTAC